MMEMLECRDDGDVETLETYISLYNIKSLCVWMKNIRIGGVEYKEIMIFCPFKHESEIVE